MTDVAASSVVAVGRASVERPRKLAEVYLQMRLTLAAVGAVVAALIQLTILPYLRIAGAEPDLILVLAVTTAAMGGFENGLAWAFFGGLMIDLLAPRPLGITVFTMLVCVGIAAVVGRALDRIRLVVAVGSVFVLSLFSSLLFLVVYGLLRGRVAVSDPIALALPDAIYSAGLAVLIMPVFVAARLRAAERERIAW